jgi:hypothetical protein
MPILKKNLDSLIQEITTKIKKELTTGKHSNPKAPVVQKKIQPKKTSKIPKPKNQKKPVRKQDAEGKVKQRK